MPPEWECLRGVAALALLYDLSLLLLSAVAQPLAALLPYGCGTPLAGAALPILQKCAVISVYRGTTQCGERQQCRYFASSLPPGKRHSRLTTVRRGCCQVATRRDSWRSHVHRTYIAQRVQSFKLQTRNVRGQGAEPLAFSWGSKGAILSRERMAPLFRAAPSALPLPPAPCAGNSLTRWANQKSATFLKNPLDKWAPRAIMQPTSEELQTYDGEK